MYSGQYRDDTHGSNVPPRGVRYSERRVTARLYSKVSSFEYPLGHYRMYECTNVRTQLKYPSLGTNLNTIQELQRYCTQYKKQYLLPIYEYVSLFEKK